MGPELLEGSLIGMNDDAFHRLGDHFLFYEYGEQFNSINPVGQTEAKQKSRGGTPDTTIKLQNGKYVLIQYTTQEHCKKKSAFFQKLKNDLIACFDENKTSIALEDIDHIILCCNSNPEQNRQQELYELCEDKKITLQIINLSTLAHKIRNLYPFLAKDYLGIELDTYQILPLEKFLTEYEKGGFATPLTNPFFFREEELLQIKQSISEELLTIVTGKPGVGKSKLAIEALKQYANNNDQYVVFCLKNKDLSVLHDLRRYMITGKSYLIFLDDANQNLSQLRALLTFYQESQIDFKIVLTVREYVFSEILPVIKELGYRKISISVFERDSLKKIISSEPFSIRHPAFVQRILAISHGNARLAIMTAIVAKDAYLHELDNLTVIYDNYFQKLTTEKICFFEGSKLKILGFIAFFKVVEKDKSDKFHHILGLFNIDEDVFWKTVNDLEEAEFVDVFTDRSTVRISDQILESYVFYKCFFIERQLDYQIILEKCFPEFSKRISSTIIDVNNTFGHENLKSLILPFISKRYYADWESENKKIKFLNIFWMYLQEETLYYLKQRVDMMPDEELVMMDSLTYSKSNWHIVLENDLILNKDIDDSLFDLLSQYLLHYTTTFESAVLLMFKYMHKCPALCEKLVQYIKSHFCFFYIDAQYDYIREKTFTILLIREIKESSGALLYLFVRLCPHFLKTHFQGAISIGTALSLTTNDITLTSNIKEIRDKYWNYLEVFFKIYPNISNHTLKKIIDGFWMDYSPEVRKYDIKYIENIMLKYMNMSKIADVVLVNEFIRKLSRKRYTSSSLKQLKAMANTETYLWYNALDWNLLRNKERHENEGEDYSAFRKRFELLKVKELITVFDFDNEEDYNRFLFFVLDCQNVARWDFYNVATSTNILFQHFLKNNSSAFFSFAASLVKNKLFLKIVRVDDFVNLLINNFPLQISETEKMFSEADIVNQQNLFIAFYSNLPDRYINKDRFKHFSDVLSKLNGWHYLDFKNVTNYEVYQKDFLLYHLRIILNRASNGKCQLSLDRDFIRINYAKLMTSPLFVQELYRYLDKENNHYDYNGKELLFLLDKDPDILSVYVRSIIEDKKLKREEHHQLRHVWKTDNYLEHITDIFDQFHNYKYFSWEFERVLEDLFERGESIPELEKKRFLFFQHYIKTYCHDGKRMKVCFKIINGKFSAHKDEFTLYFLSQNRNLEVFKKISWTDDGVVLHSGDFNSGVRDEAVYNRLKNLIIPLEPKLDYLGHLSYLSLQIDYSRRSAIHEQKWNFTTDY